MKSFNKTLGLLLSHSYITLGAILTITIALQFIVFIATAGEGESEKAVNLVTLTNIVLGFFVGIYFAGGLVSLRSNYLWKINSKYRHTIVLAFVTLLTSFTLLLVPIAYSSISNNMIILSLPFSSAVLASFILIGKNLLEKTLIFGLVFIIYQFGLSLDNFYALIMIICIGLILYLTMESASNLRNNPKPMLPVNANNGEISLLSPMAVKHSLISTINYYLGFLISHQLSKRPNKFVWSVTVPHTKLAISSFFYVMFWLFFATIADSKEKNGSDGIAFLLVSMFVVSISMEVKHLLKQTNCFAHVFSAEQHKSFRENVLQSVMQMYLTNVLVFVISVISLSWIFSYDINPESFLVESILIMILAFSFSPLFLCIRWVKVSIAQIVVVGSYVLSIFGTFKGLSILVDSKQDLSFSLLLELTGSIYPYIFIGLCFALHLLAKRLFQSQSIESLFKIN